MYVCNCTSQGENQWLDWTTGAARKAETLPKATKESIAPEADRYDSPCLPLPNKPSVSSSAPPATCKTCKMHHRTFQLLLIHCLLQPLPGHRLKLPEDVLLLIHKQSWLCECNRLQSNLHFLLSQRTVVWFMRLRKQTNLYDALQGKYVSREETDVH